MSEDFHMQASKIYQLMWNKNSWISYIMYVHKPINSSSKNANKPIDGVHQVVGNLNIAFKIHPNFFQLALLILITLQSENHLFLKPCNLNSNAKIIPQMIP